ncbi:protein DD3-3-like [Octopus sinensis]|uniref:Protein DD3-3-like n=1 Tax=Octopus sinensis TaxID=2607531 RepID=A0A7E6EJV4_9MOLL|nr:protein DD3-3-like [Octopus sinensis]
MSKCAIPCLLLFFIVIIVKADIYLHNPRGSNNRLNENTAGRRNANRLFDSQNNNNGGYNVGDRKATAARTASDQYQMKYFQSSAASAGGSKQGRSILKLEWTNQHGCGITNDTNPSKRQCNIVLQYMCQKLIVENPRDRLRDGTSTNTQAYIYRNGYPANLRTYNSYKSIVRTDRGLHENWDWYDKCMQREQNGGLFSADQKLTVRNGYIRSTSTRQNRNGARRGYECPEERDYYPYWHPTPWIDIAVFAQNQENCSYYIKNSFNSHTYGECVQFYPDGVRRHASRWNNAFECKCHKGTWVQFSSYLELAPELKTVEECVSARKSTKINYIWGIPYDTKNITKKECMVAPEKPFCSQAPVNRLNHLGNGIGGETNSFDWKLPYFPSGSEMRCVYRARYNIRRRLFHNRDKRLKTTKTLERRNRVPVQNKPGRETCWSRTPVGNQHCPVRQNLPGQSHVFPLDAPSPGLDNETINNLNVRGKRGNIVQVFPAVEYDFVPNNLEMDSEDLVHIQWTGSNTHNNRNNGNAGQGTDGTDRSNILQMAKGGVSYPLAFADTTLWNNSEIVWIYHNELNIKQWTLLSVWLPPDITRA